MSSRRVWRGFDLLYTLISCGASTNGAGPDILKVRSALRVGVAPIMLDSTSVETLNITYNAAAANPRFQHPLLPTLMWVRLGSAGCF